MAHRSQLEQVKAYLWKIPESTRDDMRVPAYLFAAEDALEGLLEDHSLEQLMNVSTLPGIQEAAIAMPDMHQGYGFPIGGVAATAYPEGTISPGGIGYDINCGVRLLKTKVSYDDIKNRASELTRALYAHIPTGAGKSGPLNLSHKELTEVLIQGARWPAEHGYGDLNDLEGIESGGVLDHADISAVSDRALQRGQDQLGTLGGGNHFLEMDRISTIFDKKTAEVLGLQPGQIVFLIHSGSRGFGHQIATEYTRKFRNKLPEYGITLPDRGLACAPLNTADGQNYFNAMAAAANFAWANREVLTWQVRQAWKSVFGSNGISQDIELVYDISHNIAKLEEHEVEGTTKEVMVHRKGATRAFGPGHPEITEKYRSIGQPVMIPGSMGTSSYVLTGLQQTDVTTFGSSCHGAGRRMSRTEAKSKVNADDLKQDLQNQGIYLQAGSKRGAAEEAPLAYKDVDMVIDTVKKAGIAKKVAKMHPVGVIKG